MKLCNEINSLFESEVSAGNVVLNVIDKIQSFKQDGKSSEEIFQKLSGKDKIISDRLLKDLIKITKKTKKVQLLKPRRIR